jgi:hypothetical protein
VGGAPAAPIFQKEGRHRGHAQQLRRVPCPSDGANYFLSRHTLEELTEPVVGRDDILTGLTEAVDLPFHFNGKFLTSRPHVPLDMKPPILFADRNKLAVFKRYEFCATIASTTTKSRKRCFLA